MSVNSSDSSNCSLPSPVSDPGSERRKDEGAYKLKRRWIDMAEREENHQTEGAFRGLSAGQKGSAGRPRKQMKLDLNQDPRRWSKQDVSKWLDFMTNCYDIAVPTTPLNASGKVLVDMSIADFVKHVPTGGKFLYRDFRLRLHKAMFLHEAPKSSCDESKLSPLQLLMSTAGKYLN